MKKKLNNIGDDDDEHVCIYLAFKPGYTKKL